MKKKKKFDCVEMKNEIQQNPDNRFVNLNSQERIKFLKERLKNNKQLSKFLEMFEVKTA